MILGIPCFVLILCVLLSQNYGLARAQFENEIEDAEQYQSRQGHHQPQQQQITLTRDAIERLLQSLTSNCRVEMEGALATQTQDISDPCKVEIQEALKLLSPQDFVNPGQYSPLSPDEAYDSPQNDEDPFAVPPSGRRTPTARSPGSVSPSMAIAAFVVTLIAAAVALIYYRNSAPVDKSKSPVKKLSKKKVYCFFISLID